MKKIFLPATILLCILGPFGYGQSSWKKQFKGHISDGNTWIDIEMRLNIFEGDAKGNYYYVSSGTGANISLEGIFLKNQLKLDEKNAENKITGNFSGTYDPKTSTIKGKWTRKKDNKTFDFSLEPTTWVDYNLIVKKNETISTYKNFSDRDTDCDLLMVGNPDTLVQSVYNGGKTLADFKVTKVVDTSLWEARNFAMDYLGVGTETDIEFYEGEYLDVKSKDNFFISVRRGFEMYSGGSVERAFDYTTFDLVNRTDMDIENMLRKDTASLDILKFWIVNAFKEEKKNIQKKYTISDDDFGDDFPYDTAKVHIEKNFIADNKLYFYYEPYAAFFGPENEICVTIDHKKLIQILDKNSSLYRWIKSQ